MEETNKILHTLGDHRQVILSTSTFNEKIGTPEPISEFLKDYPRAIPVISDTYQVVNPSLKVDFSYVGDDQVNGMQHLLNIVKTSSASQIVVFTSYISRTLDIFQQLTDEGISTSVLHSDQDIEERAESLFDFLSKRTRVLVGTELAVRALSKPVDHVVLYNIPPSPSSLLMRLNKASRRVSCIVRNGEEEFAKKIKPGATLKLDNNRRIRKRA